MQFVHLTFPSFSVLAYDPTSTFATSDATLNQELNDALATSGSAISRCVTIIAALLCAAAAIALV